MLSFIFTAEEDKKLIDLKENQGLSWKDIIDYFPKRTIGALQVRYCTKLKTGSLRNEIDRDIRSIVLNARPAALNGLVQIYLT